MQNFENKWLFQIPLSDVEDIDYSNKTKSVANPCLLCGKHIKNEKYFVHLLTNGNLISTEEDIEESQGFFSIGSDCKNRLPNNFYFAINQPIS